MSIFFDFPKTSLLRSKKLSFLSRISKMFLSLLFCSKKKNLSEKGRFFDKNHGLTPLQNVDSLEFYRTFLFWSEKHSFLCRTSKMSLSGFFCSFLWLFLLKRNIWKKGRFFDKNHGLTPLQNVDFFRHCENFTFEVQKTLFSIQNIKRMFLSCFFAQKKNL